MSDFTRGYRPSINVNVAPPEDGLRWRWMIDMLQPDAQRSALGQMVLTPEQKNGIINTLDGESRYYAPGQDYYGMGRLSAQGPGPEITVTQAEYPPLGQQSFMARNDEAVFGSQIGRMLSGAPDPEAQANGALGLGAATPLLRLGQSLQRR